MKDKLPRFLREPVVVFLAIGIVLFAISALITGRSDSGRDTLVQVTAADISWLRDNWAARWQRPPTETELSGLVDDYVREEILYREALAMGLDQNDQIIRRRLVQKLELMTEDLASQVQPSEAEPQTFFRENIDDYRIPERRSFQHIYFNLDGRGEQAVLAAESLLAELRASSSATLRPWELGDRFLLQYEYPLLSSDEVSRAFGQRFAAELFELELGHWQGPVQSGYGLHLVLVTGIEAARVPALAEVRRAVQNDYATSIRETAEQALYESVSTRYEVVIDSVALDSLALKVGSNSAGP